MKNYYDYAASTPIKDYVLKAMEPWYQDNYANPSSKHEKGKEASIQIQNSREIIADKIGAMPSEIIFTSGATEANNLALKGIAFSRVEQKGHIITSAIEHKCILNTCLFLESLGFRVTYLIPTKDGFIEPAAVARAICSDTFLISIQHVNNELGTINELTKIGKIAFENNVQFHTDAAQSFCKINIDVDVMNVDMLSLSGHKVYGPKGIGALYIRDARTANLTPLIHGGGQELGLRGGTSPTHLIAGLSAAVQNFPIQVDTCHNEVLNSLLNFDYKKNGGQNSLSSIMNITFNNHDEEKRFLLAHKWLISNGSACNAITNQGSHVLKALGLSDSEARRTYRISLPPYCEVS